METYKNLGGNSGVVAYLIGDDSIVVRFASGQHTFYRYTYASAGSEAVERMKSLAAAGRGLNGFISTRATQPPYFRKGNSLLEVNRLGAGSNYTPRPKPASRKVAKRGSKAEALAAVDDFVTYSSYFQVQEFLRGVLWGTEAATPAQIERFIALMDAGRIPAFKKRRLQQLVDKAAEAEAPNSPLAQRALAAKINRGATTEAEFRRHLDDTMGRHVDPNSFRKGKRLL